jgi:hypothetical protein
MAAGMENGDLLQELWVWAKEALTTEEIMNSLFFVQDIWISISGTHQ